MQKKDFEPLEMLVKSARRLENETQITIFFQFLESLKFDIHEPLFHSNNYREQKLNYIEYIASLSDSSQKFLLHILPKAKNANALHYLMDSQRTPHDIINKSINKVPTYFEPCKPSDYSPFSFADTPITHYLNWIISRAIIDEKAKPVLLKITNQLLVDTKNISSTIRCAIITQLCIVANKAENAKSKKRKTNSTTPQSLAENNNNFSEEFSKNITLLIQKNDLNQFKIPLLNENKSDSFCNYHGFNNLNMDNITIGVGSAFALLFSCDLMTKEFPFSSVFSELFNSLNPQSFLSYPQNFFKTNSIKQESELLKLSTNVLPILGFNSLLAETSNSQKYKPLNKQNKILLASVQNNISEILQEPIELLTLSKSFNFERLRDSKDYSLLELDDDDHSFYDFFPKMDTFEALGFSFANNNQTSQFLVPLIIKEIQKPHFDKLRSQKILNNLINGFVLGAKTLAPVELQNSIIENSPQNDEPFSLLNIFSFPDIYFKNLETILNLSQTSASLFTQKLLKNLPQLSNNYSSLSLLFLTTKLFEHLSKENKHDDENMLKIIEHISLKAKKESPCFIGKLEDFYYKTDIENDNETLKKDYENLLKSLANNSKYIPKKNLDKLCLAIQSSMAEDDNGYQDEDFFLNFTKSQIEALKIEHSTKKTKIENKIIIKRL